MAEGSEFKVALDGNPALDTCEYTVTDVTNKTATKEVTPPRSSIGYRER